MSIEQQTIDHRSIKRKSWRSRSRGAERRSRAAGARQARDESRDTKTFLKKLRATERGRGEQKNYKHAHTAKKQVICIYHRSPHYAQNLIAQKLLVFWGRRVLLLGSSHKAIKRGGGPPVLQAAADSSCEENMQE